MKHDQKVQKKCGSVATDTIVPSADVSWFALQGSSIASAFHTASGEAKRMAHMQLLSSQVASLEKIRHAMILASCSHERGQDPDLESVS